MAYLGKTPSQAVRSRYYFTASGGETSLAPAQVTGLSFTDANYVDVSLNGVALVSGTDYTATPSTNTISSLSALTASDVVEIVVYDTFSVFGGSVNGDFNISGGTLAAEAVTVTGLTTTGNINFGDNAKAIFGAGSDLQIYHDGSNSYVTDQGAGDMYITTLGNAIYFSKHGTESLMALNVDGDVKLYHNNAEKLATTSTGVDVTGTTTTDGLEVKNGTTQQLVIGNSGSYAGAEYGELLFKEGSTELARVKWNPSGNTFQLINNIAGPMTFATNNTTRMTITSGGSVGIGTSSPDAFLTVKKDNPSNGRVATFGSNGTPYTGTATGLTNAVTISRTLKTIAASTTTSLVNGYGGSIVLITLSPDTGVDDIQYTFLVTHGWNSASVLFTNSYGGNTATFTFSASTGNLQVNHNHTGAIKFNVATLVVPAPGSG